MKSKTWLFLLSFALMLGFLPLAAQPDLKQVTVEVVTDEFIFSDPPFAECHASSVVELSDGKMMSSWFGGTHEKKPDVTIWGSIKTDDGWSEPTEWADGIISESERYACWNPVLFQTRENELFLFYKVGPSPREWWGEYKTSTDNGATWSDVMKLPDGLLGPIRNKPIYLANGSILSGSSVETKKTWHAHMEISEDHGQTWSKVSLDTTTGFRIIQPTLMTLENGDILAYMRSKEDYVIESRSSNQGKTWSVPRKTQLPNSNAGIDAVTLSNGLHVLVYNPLQQGEWEEERTKLFVAVSEDGENWEDVHKLEDNEEGEFSYPAVIQSSDGRIHITYTHDRTNIRYVVLELAQ